MWQRLKTEFKEQIWDNEQILKVRQKFAELDSQTQSYVIIGSFAGFVLILLLTFFTLWGKTILLKNELASMDDDIRYTQNAATRIEELKAEARTQSSDSLLRDFDINLPIAALAERATQKSLISKSNVEVGEEKNNGVIVKLTKISLRQLVRMLYLFEQSGAGATVEKLSIDSKDDPEGYLWAEILVRKAPKMGGI
ncbi:MAG: hypothetical protein ACXWQO_07430 [Bdellovibrionota bacterium]